MPAKNLDPTGIDETAATVDGSIESRRQAALLRAGALQRAILNSANFSSIATDEKGVIQIFNVGAERMLGYAAADVMNKITPAEISDPQELIARAEALSVELATPITPGFEALVFKASRGIEDIYELTYIRKDGSRFPAIVSVTALRDERDKIIGYLLIGTDNTARKQAEAESRHQRTVADLEAFNYSVSHDLRGPLRSIDGFSQALIEDFGPTLSGEANRYLRLIRESTQEMSQLIDDLLRLALIGRSEMRHEPADLSAMAERILVRLAEATPDRHVVWEVEPGLGAVGDPPLLRTALENLLANAWKFTGKRADARIEVGRMAGARAEFWVRDNGVGFDPAYAGKLFGAFQRLHSSSEFKGTGIGLAIVQQVVRRHGGEVRAESAPGAGATFFFTLADGKERLA